MLPLSPGGRAVPCLVSPPALWPWVAHVALYIECWTAFWGFGSYFSFATALLSEFGKVASLSCADVTDCCRLLWLVENTMAKDCSMRERDCAPGMEMSSVLGAQWDSHFRK